MLKFTDKNNKVIFVLRDEDLEPISIDDLIINDQDKQPVKKEGKDNGTCKR